MSESVRVDVFEAKTHFTQLLRQVHEGMSFTITQGDVALADLVPARAPDRRVGKDAAQRMREFMKLSPSAKKSEFTFALSRSKSRN